MNMAEETKPQAQPKARGYKLAKGASLDLTGVPFKVTNETLKDPAKVALIARKCPGAFEQGMIVPA